MKVKDIMRKAVTIDECSTLEQVVKKMAEEKVNSILVVNNEWILVGSVDIVTLIKTIVPEYVWNRDFSVANFATEEVLDEYIEDNKDKKVKYFMLHEPKLIKDSSSILSAIIKVTEWRQARIPVVDEDNKPLWVVTRNSVKNYIAAKMWFSK